MTTLFIEPADLLLFRDGRRFSAGDHLATGVFPPLPTTFYGALRATLLAAHGADFHVEHFSVDAAVTEVAGTKIRTGSLGLTGFTLARRENGVLTRYLPLPRDVLVRKGDEEEPPEQRSYHLLQPLDSPGAARTNLPEGVPLLWTRHDGNDFYKNAVGYLPEMAFLRLLSGEIDAVRRVVEPAQLFRPEPRTSAQVNPTTHTAAEGQLFTVEFTRMARHVGFILSLEDEGLLPDTGWLRLGGEARAAHYEQVSLDEPAVDMLKQKVRQRRHLKVVLMTPAPFEHGWRPGFIDARGEGTLGSCDVRLRGTAIGRYQHLGGWDMAEGRPKRTRRAVPAGSVYFFEVKDGDVDRLFKDCFGHSLCAKEDDRKQGLGLAYLGTY